MPQILTPHLNPPAASQAVKQGRISNGKEPDFYPTPPWATRALIGGLQEHTHWQPSGTCWEPAAGAGHMVLPLQETFENVHASDLYIRTPIRDGIEIKQADFLSTERLPEGVTSIVTNPPFGNRPEAFFNKALDLGPPLIAFLLRQNCASTRWMADVNRRAMSEGYRPIRFETAATRIPMLKNRCEKSASTATAYSWFVALSHQIDLKHEASWSCFYMPDRKLEKDGDYDRVLGVADDTTPPPLFAPQTRSQISEAQLNHKTYRSYSGLVICLRDLLSQGENIDKIELVKRLMFQATYAKITGEYLALALNQEERTFLGEELVEAYESHKKDIGFCDG